MIDTPVFASAPLALVEAIADGAAKIVDLTQTLSPDFPTIVMPPELGQSAPVRIEQISRSVFKVNPGSLLVALQRLERAGWLEAEWRQTASSRRAKFYILTRAGRKQLEVETEDWARRVGAVARLLRAEG